MAGRHRSRAGIIICKLPLRGDARACRSSRGSLRATMPVRVVGVDHHRLIRDGVRAIFDRGSECGAVGESENSAEAVQLCRKSRPDIVLMDIGLLARILRAYSISGSRP